MKNFFFLGDTENILCYNSPNKVPEVFPMFRSLFHPDSALMITMTQITDCIFLSLFWLLCCFPLVTAGAATAALYDAVYRCFRKGEKYPWHRYWHAFRSNLKASLFTTILFLLLTAALSWVATQLWNNAVYGNISWSVFAGAAFVLFVLVGILSILFPMLSRFENTTAALWGNTFRLGLGKLPLTLGLAAINSVTIFLCIRYIFPLFFLPAVTALISTVFLEPMLKPYITEEEAAA